MSIGVEKVNGGVNVGQWTEGSLTYLTVTGPAGAFNGSFGLSGKAAVGSAAEAVYQALSGFGTPVIFEIASATVIYVAMAYGTGAAADMQVVLRAFASADYNKYTGAVVTSVGNTLEVVAVDFAAATVVAGDFAVA